MPDELKVLFFADVVGRPGREVVKNFLAKNQERYSEYFVIANVENASHGFGLTKKNHDELASYGIHCMSSGNHIWDKKDIFEYINGSETLIRPLNYHKSAPGVGYRIFTHSGTQKSMAHTSPTPLCNNKLIVINLLGKSFMNISNCPFAALETLLKELKNDMGDMEFSNKIIFVDFHAEASAEKICFAKFAASLGVSAVLGTHTHVQTADERILDERCAFITDVGFCGAVDGVIGMDYEISLRRMITDIPERFDVAESSSSQINACKVVFDYNSGDAKSIERINLTSEVQSES